MGNKASSSIRNRMTIGRANGTDEDDEYTPADIKRKFDNMPKLSADEVKVIKSSWNSIREKLRMCGAETFMRMFEMHPDTRLIFSKFEGIDLVALEQSMEVKEHGERVMKIVEKVVHNLDNYQKIWDLLLGYGKIHFGYGALPMYFEMMGPHFIIAIRGSMGEDWYEALEYHWLALFNLIVYVMKFGWNLKRAEEQKRARNLNQKRNGR